MGSNGRKKHAHGVFCLEGDWWNDLKKPATVEPVLRLLSESHPSHVPYIHRDVGTVAELQYYLQKWVQARHDRYPILYLGFHGYPETLCVGDGRRCGAKVTLEELGGWMSGQCAGKVVLFGACETMDTNKRRLQKFLHETKGLAMLGYRHWIDWLDSAVFETFVLGQLQHNSMTKQGLQAAKNRIHRLLRGSPFYKELGFRMEIREN
jgi:hypothetical protein